MLLDTNLWSYIGDEGSVDQLNNLAKHHGLSLVLPPSILMEVARVPDVAVFTRIVRALTTGPRSRTPSEAELEAAEVVSEARRLRPAWIRKRPDSAAVAGWNNLWTKKIWKQAQEQPEAFLQAVAESQNDPTGIIVARQHVNRAGMLKSGGDWADMRPWILPPDPVPSDQQGVWTGRGRVEAWRVEAFALYWHELRHVHGRSLIGGHRSTYADWLGSYAHLAAMTRDMGDFAAFWFDEVEVSAVRRTWLRWAMDWAQTQMKITEGNARDAQHAAHLVDCDIFATADKRMSRALSVTLKAAPFGIGTRVLLVPASAAEGTPDRLRHALASMGD